MKTFTIENETSNIAAHATTENKLIFAIGELSSNLWMTDLKQ